MPKRRLRTLIIGLIMTFVGPALGLVIYFAVVFHLLLPGQSAPSLAEAMANFQAIPRQMFLAMSLLALGFLCGASGLVVIISTLAVHFLGQDTAPAYSPPASKHRPAVENSPKLAKYSYGPNP